MKSVIRITFLIDFLVQQPIIYSYLVNSKVPCGLAPKNQIRSPTFRRNFVEFGPKRDENYNPNYGYEPYWPDSEWVFSKHVTTTTGKTVTQKITCPVDCPRMYEEFGAVCGRNKNYTHKTFNNYCELQQEDCSGRSKWLIAYRGKCQDDLKTYPTKRSDLVTRALKYISDFVASNPPTLKLKGWT